MPFGHAIIAMRLLDQDDGDESEFGTTEDQLMDYLSARMLSFEFSDHCRKKDQVKMVFRNDDYQMFDRPVFAKGQKLLLTWGWPGRTAPPRRMIVKSVRGGEEITVTGHCVVSLLDRKKRSRFMQGVTDSEWVHAIADEYRYTGTLATIETTEERRDITQPRWMTDARMLRKLAKRNGFEFYIDATGLHWHKRPTDREPVKNFIYRRDPGVGDVLAPPQFDANLSKGISRVKIKSRDPLLKTYVEQSIGLKDEIDVSLGHEDEMFDTEEESESGRRGNRIGEEEVLPGGLMAEQEALTHAKGRYRETAKRRYKMTLEIVGNARVGAKQIIGLWGDVSETMAGLYYVKESVTTITAGEFFQTLSCEKDALQKVKASQKRSRRNNVNKKTDSTEQTPESDALKLYVKGVTLPSGEVVPGYIYSDDGGKTGQTRQMTEEEFNALSDYQKDQFRYSLGAVTYPDP